jgi:adenylate cyclase
MKGRRWLWLPARAVQNFLLAAIIATLSMLLSSDFGYHPFLTPFYSLERIGYDYLFTFRQVQPQKIDPRIRVVGFDRSSEKDLGSKTQTVRWPPPRHFDAQVIRNLAKDGAALIVFDVLFSDGTNPKDDKELDQAIKEAGNVILPMRIDRDPDLNRKMLEEPYYNDDLGIDFLAAAKDGFAEVPKDPDTVVRRYTPVMYFRGWQPSMTAAAYLKLNGYDEKAITVTKNYVQLGGLIIPNNGPSFIDSDKSVIPSTFVDFPAGNTAFSLETDFADVALGTFPKGEFKGKIVFIGLTGQEETRENFDVFITAYTNHGDAANFGSQGLVNTMPGVFLQALYLNDLMHQGFVKHLPMWSAWVLIFGVTIAGAAGVRSSFNWRGPAILYLSVLSYIYYTVFSFDHLLLYVPWVVPSILILSSLTLVTYFERGALRRKWSGYVSPQVLDHILKADEESSAQRHTATVIFADIRGFTTFTAKHSPETVVKLLNLHFERMTKIIYEQNGTIDKFLGDGMMSLFGAPVARDDSGICAVRAAWQMCQISKEPMMLDGEAYVFDSGFGITTGSIVAGHVGSKTRHDYTVIGEAVNMAARLQGVTGAGDVIIDAATYDLVRDYVEVDKLEEVRLKGIAEPVVCYKVTEWHETPGSRRVKRPRKKAGIP